MTEPRKSVAVRPGDIVEVHGHWVGDRPRLGEVLELLGTPDHRHYRVRWEDEHESIFYPSNDAIFRTARRRAQAAR
jgi:Domain of unknown function (DUF1918)